MSRASKYLRKKLAEGGNSNPEEAAKKAMAQIGQAINNEQPQFSPGIMLGGQVPQNKTQLPTQASMMEKLSQASSERSKPQAVSEELEAQLGQKPSETIDLGQELRRSPGIMQPAVMRNLVPSQAQQATAQPQMAAAAPAQAQQATAQPKAAEQQVSYYDSEEAEFYENAPSPADYDSADEYFWDYAEKTGDYLYENVPDSFWKSYDRYQDAQQPSATITAGGVPTDGDGVPDSVDTKVEDSEEKPASTKPKSEPAVTTTGVSGGSVTAPETRRPEDIPVVEDPGPAPTYNGPESGAGYEQFLVKYRNWATKNTKYQEYLNTIAEIEANLAAEKNKSGNNDMAKTEDNNLPDTRGGNPDLTGSGGTKVTGPTTGGSGSGGGGAPTGIEVTGPTYTAPEVEVAQLAEDQKVYRSQFPEGEAGTEQYKVARAKEAQKLVSQGAEQPRRGQFPDGEAGDIQYQAAIQRFRETPLAAEGTVTEAKDIQTVGEAGTVTGQAVDAKEITDVAEQAAPTAVTAPEDVAAASMEAATIGQEMPERPKAGDFDRTTEEGRQAFSAALEQFDSKLERIRGYERPRPQEYKDGQNDPAFRAAIEAFRNDPLPTTKAVEAAQGEVSEAAQAAEFEAQQAAQVATAQRDAEAEAAAQADAIEYDASQDAYVNKVTGEVATVEETAEAEAKSREAITGMPAPDGEAAQIMSMYDFNQSQQRAIQGQKAKDKAIKQLKAQGVKDDDIAQQLADNPELIADQMEDLPDDVRTTLSGLPQEALVSVQMESLMAGMEDGEVPMWARPALAKVEANLAKRGMGKSSVGRDALFNAIIQSAIPLAQSNAAAIQQATAQDKQIAADFLAKNAGFQQQMELANLSNDQQMRLANLSARNQADSESLSNAQQTELANLNARMQTNLLQGKIAAEMNQAQLNVDQQRAVTNASMVANIDMAKFNAAQQVELANSKFMQTMVQTQFNADQQAAIQNATMQASLDLATLGANEKLRAQNAQAFLQMDMANLSNEQQAAVLTAQQRQQALLSNQAAENAAAQFNAANEQQTEQFMANLATTIQQFNVQSNAAREQFNATESNRIAAINAGNKLQADQFEAQLYADIDKFNEAQDFQRDQWNAANAQAVEQSNVQWRRQSNLADTAAQNAANQQNAQIAYNLTSQELSQVWQQLRDQAAYIRQSFENEQQRKAQLLATAIGNESLAKYPDAKSKHASWLTALSNAVDTSNT